VQATLQDNGIPSAFFSLADWSVDNLESVWDEASQLLRTLEKVLIWIEFPSLGPPWTIDTEYLDFFFSAEEEGEPPFTPLLAPEAQLDTDGSDGERLRFTYAALVCQVDAMIGAVLDALRSDALIDEVTLILVSEEGISLGEHGEIGVGGNSLHEERLHVPFLVRLPGQQQAGRRVFALTQTVDLFPTLLDAFGLPAPSHYGHSLWPLLRGQAAEIRQYAIAGKGGSEATWALRTPEWCLLLGGQQRQPRLFAKPDDRFEASDLRQLYPDWVAALETTLFRFVESTRNPGDFKPPPLPDQESVEGSEPQRSEPDVDT
jgi:hypothetical protein